MIKKYWRPIVIVMLLVVLGWLVSCNGEKEKPFKKVELKSTNLVYNYTQRKYLDTIIIVGLNLSKIENTQALIHKMNSPEMIIEGEECEMKAYIVKNGTQYIIYIIDASRKESIEILSHEFIHYKQFYDKRFVIDGTSVEWEGKKYADRVGSYLSRPWEVEAFKNSAELEKQIKKKLY